MSDPLVSIVVPSFNQAQYLGAALDSVLCQDYPNIEVVICNHGSTDETSSVISDLVRSYETAETDYLDRMLEGEGGSLEFIRTKQRRYPPGRKIKVFESKENIGATASYNVGFRNCTGKYVTYLVGDDRLTLHFVRRLVDELEETGADYVYADMAEVDDSCRMTQLLRKPDYSFERSLADWYHLGVAKLYRRDLHSRVGYYDESYRRANDYDMALRFALAGATFRHVPELLYYVRLHLKDGSVEPAGWKNDGFERLMEESILCAKRARQALKEGRVRA